MHSILVVFVILLAILLLVSALGGSLNIQEKFEEDEQPTVAEMMYESIPQEEQPPTEEMPTSVPTYPVDTPTSDAVQPAVETFSNGVEPFEDEDAKYGAPL